MKNTTQNTMKKYTFSIIYSSIALYFAMFANFTAERKLAHVQYMAKNGVNVAPDYTVTVAFMVISTILAIAAYTEYNKIKHA